VCTVGRELQPWSAVEVPAALVASWQPRDEYAGLILSAGFAILSSSSSSSTIIGSISWPQRAAQAHAVAPVRATLRCASYASLAPVASFLRFVNLARLRLRSSFSRMEAASKTTGPAPGIAMPAVAPGARTDTVGAKVALAGAVVARTLCCGTVAAALAITSGSAKAVPLAVAEKNGDGDPGWLLGGDSGNTNCGGAAAFWRPAGEGAQAGLAGATFSLLASAQTKREDDELLVDGIEGIGNRCAVIVY